MQFEGMPEEAEKLWDRGYQQALKRYDGDEERASKVAFSALEAAGWSKDEDGNWNKKAVLNELSLTIKKASYDADTNERRWRAETSDTGEDVRGDNMTLELFSDFTRRIEANEKAPYSHRSDFWSGGMPYVSISHYPDYSGDGVPGEVRAVYVDGNFLKAKGLFDDTPLGTACWDAICKDLQDDDLENKIRVSIGFLDYAHTHKESGYEFERKTLDDMCPECFLSMFTGENEAREFTKGQLVHLALTRIPANQRTDINPDMEVRSMATQKEDAASIVGEEQAEELDSKQTSIPEEAKSEALIVKTDEVEDAILIEMRSMLEKLSEVEEVEVEPHILDNQFEAFRASYDEVFNSEASHEDKLKAIQEPFNVFGQAIIETIKGESEDVEPSPQDEAIKTLSETVGGLEAKLDLLLAQKQEYKAPEQATQRRSITGAEAVPALMNAEVRSNKPMTIEQIARQSVGLPS